jgi:xanthine/CO dehydrogenase XdhC/CoxF family maturation factor
MVTGMPASLGWPAQGQRDMCLMRARSEASTRMSNRQQPWSEDVVRHGRILVLSDNPISRSIAAIASTAGRTVVVEPADDGGPGLEPLAGDAVVLCDHDAPDAPAVLRAALASDASYVAMMASRGRAAGLLDDLAAEGVDVSTLHVPAGHDLGGRAPGEIALSVVAEIVAESYGRPGGPMRG